MAEDKKITYRPQSSRGLHHDVSPFRKLLFGRPIESELADHSRLPKFIALPVFASDAISSVAYASQEILLVLGAAGLWATQYRHLYSQLTMGITAGIVFLMIVVVSSYWQTIFAYPSGGGSYIVSKDNLGTACGLIAGAALLIDYVLTVAVSIASGVQNLLAIPLLQSLIAHQEAVCIVAIGFLTLANMRGLKESGSVFSIFTYGFVVMAVVMIACGTIGPLLGWTIHADTVNQFVPAGAHEPAHHNVAGLAIIALILKAFASGCSAMTGVEAVSNGVPAFQKPESKNAAVTLLSMAAILGVLFFGISYLATSLHVVYWKHGDQTSLPVIDQLSGAVFGKTGNPLRVAMYYCMQGFTAAILVLAANTSFADFPRLTSLMAKDRFLPRQLTNLGDKLVFSNGIALLGVLAMLLIVFSGGIVDRLIPLYAVGVFTAFTLSQSGMVLHWMKLKEPGWQNKAIVNGFGALCTSIVLLTIVVEKGPEGAWWVVIVAGILVSIFLAIHRHYEYLRGRLTIIGYKADHTPLFNTVLILIPSLHRGVFPAIKYARSISSDCRAIHIETEHSDSLRLQHEWEQYVGDDVPLVVLTSPYRSIIAPILVYLDEVRLERSNHVVTVVLPEFVSTKWFHHLLHNKNGLLLKIYLANRPGVITSNVRYLIDDDGQPGQEIGN
ncbi:MAG: APC family permease [Armatimonadota bacterium]